LKGVKLEKCTLINKNILKFNGFIVFEKTTTKYENYSFKFFRTFKILIFAGLLVVPVNTEILQ